MAQTIDERIIEIETEIRKTPYHKGTEHHIGKLKARIAKLKEEKFQKGVKGGRGGGGGYAVAKTGDASIVFVGPPSVGKSTLLNQLTNAQSKVGAYDFTTQEVIPGMMDYKGAKLQIFDVPGIIEGAAKGRGRGKEVLSVARSSNLIVIVVDVKTPNLIPLLKKELYENGIRLDEEKPKIEILKKTEGGIKVNATTKLTLAYETIKELAAEFRLPNAEIIVKENISMDRLIDVFMANRVYLPYLVVVNKIDLGIPKDFKHDDNTVFISAQNKENLEELKARIWKELDLIRVYLKKDEKIDYQSPFILKKGKTLNDLLQGLFIVDKERYTYAKINGPGAKFAGQEVSLTFTPQDETVVQFQ
ncbi:GTP-binding protein [Candidatus Shapirobacteria bacterium CG09_land_8_20_14_0_10_39_12]|uniref:GTP-binding protein n=1 Tax=Candidatus Shapirobacteria bacterium CG09_land_8_20_14_0_10_39_12 TaxID=1974885 RepID=A0A2H0WPE6_9BACT|nr:MAG: GTP-binding protein [Candidatus Shapirobacteria bacterium CG09_land_8_20_14_0_10_39_12]